MKCMRSVCKKPDTKGSHAIKITKQTFDCSLMVFKRRMHELGEFVHDKGNIRLSHPEMLEATDHLTIHGGKVKNIGFNGYMGTWILRIYRWIFLHEYRYIKN